MNKLIRRRSVFVRTGKLPPLKLTERDKRILKLVGELQIATSKQIRRSHFATSTITACNRRLQKLWLHSYLDRIFPPSILLDKKSTPGTPRIYYRLTGRGASELGTLDAEINAKAKGPSPFLYNHQHDVNEFRTSLESALRQRFGHGAGFTWTPESILRKRNLIAKQKNPNLSRSNYLVLADGLFSFVAPSGVREFFFLEIDRGTESLWRLVQRAKAYIRLHQSGLKSTIHAVPSFRVLIVTTSHDRLMNLRAQIAGIGQCFNMFWFTTFSEKAGPDNSPRPNITPETILEPIWQKITDGDMYSLSGCAKRAGQDAEKNIDQRQTAQAANKQTS